MTKLKEEYPSPTVSDTPAPLSFCSLHTELLTALGIPGASWHSQNANRIHQNPSPTKSYIQLQSVQENYICKAAFGLAKI